MRSLPKRLWYNFLHVVLQLAAVLLFRVRCQGRTHVPKTGGGLVCSNHQSHLDPALVGLVVNRRMNYLARQSLFHFAPLRWILRSVGTIPIDREGLGLAGLKETLRRLRRDELVLLFPEGTRSHDGRVGPLKPGFCALARRARVPLLPVGIDGAYAAWPRHRLLPRLTIIHIHIGQPITPEMTASLGDIELVAELHSRIDDCCQAARKARLRACPIE